MATWPRNFAMIRPKFSHNLFWISGWYPNPEG
jgi:hypothetical protein